MAGRSRSYRDNILRVTKPAIRRLSHEGGAKRLSGLIYEEVRGILSVYLEELLRIAIQFVKYSGRKTVQQEDVKGALDELGRAYGGIVTNQCKATPKKVSKESSKSKHRFKPGTKALRDIRRLQKSSDCLVLPRTVFHDILKEKGQNEMESLRFGREAKLMLQVATETYIRDLFKHAVDIALVDKRETIMPKDLQVVRRIRGERA